MKSRFILSISISVLTVLLLLLSGCPSPLGVSDEAPISQQARVEVDPDLGLAVLKDTDGSETVISAIEGDIPVGCESVTDFILLDQDSSGRHQSGVGNPRAVVLGVRSDGRPGIWIVYRGGGVVIPVSDDGDPTSELLQVASQSDGFRWDDGWNYSAKALSDDYKIIVGVAENPDATWLTDYLGTTPKVVVWWNLYKKSNGVFYISRARVVADYPDWCIDDVKHDRHGRGRRARYYSHWLRWFLDRLGLWFFAWADDYLGDLAGPDEMDGLKPVQVVEEGKKYEIYGYNRNSEFAKALISPREVLSIEKTDPPNGGGNPGVNQPPHPVTGPSMLINIKPGSTTFQLEVNNSTNPLVFDPDGDHVTFILDSFTIDTPANRQYILDNYDISDAGVFSIPWNARLKDEFASFTIYTDDGQDQTAPDTVINVYFSTP